VNILVIGRSGEHEKNDSQKLVELLNIQAGVDIEFEHCFFEDIVISASDEVDVSVMVKNKELKLTYFSGILFFGWSQSRVLSDIAHVVASFADKAGVFVWNSELISARSMTKVSQLTYAVELGIPIARSVVSLNRLNLLERAKELQAPYIVKDVSASRGRRNFKCASLDEVDDVLRAHEEYCFVLQEFVPNDGSDLRVFYTGSRTGLVIKRISDGSTHLSNLSAGGKGELMDTQSMDPLLESYSELLARKFKRELCGIDYMFDTEKKKYVFLEINATPQIVNGAFVDDKIRAIINRLKQTQVRKEL
jgi:glutathione synthase/RimK-type ligase-like ATP-grasp enzyme